MTETSPGLRCAVDGEIATITIDHPAKRNAMTADMYSEFPPLLTKLEADPAVRVVILTGQGSTFCAGADISDLGRIGQGDQDLTIAAEEALAAFTKPVIAQIRGYCYGGACQLAAACDLRIAADDARFAITPAKLGILYPASALQRLVRLAGPAPVKYLVYSAADIDAERALREGFFNEVVPADRLAERVYETARTIAARSQFTVRASKDIIDRIADATLENAAVQRWQDAMEEAGDNREGRSAFLERREPRFGWTGFMPDGPGEGSVRRPRD